MAGLASSLWLTALIATAPALTVGLSPAFAQSAPAAGSSALAQPSAAARETESLDSQIAAFTAAPDDVAPGPGGPNEPAGLQAPRQIHGEAGAAFGSNGYRAGYVAAEIPIGTDTTLGVGVSESQARFRGGPTVRGQSLDLSLMVGGQSNPQPCRGAQRLDGSAPEPLWVSRLRDPAAGGRPAACDGGAD